MLFREVEHRLEFISNGGDSVCLGGGLYGKADQCILSHRSEQDGLRFSIQQDGYCEPCTLHFKNELER